MFPTFVSGTKRNHSCEVIPESRKTFVTCTCSVAGAGERRKMEKTTVYEYLLDKYIIIKVAHEAKIIGDRYVFKSGKNEKTQKILRKEELGEVVNNHIFALEDNFPKYEHEIIRSMKKSYYETEDRQTKKKTIIGMLEGHASPLKGSMACIGCRCDRCNNACCDCVRCIRAEYGEDGWEDYYNDEMCSSSDAK